MPLPLEIDKFKQQLTQIGNEPAVLAAKGMAPPDHGPPSQEEADLILSANALKVRKNPNAQPDQPKAAPSGPTMEDLLSSAFGQEIPDTDSDGTDDSDTSVDPFGFDDLFGNSDTQSADGSLNDREPGLANSFDQDDLVPDFSFDDLTTQDNDFDPELDSIVDSDLNSPLDQDNLIDQEIQQDEESETLLDDFLSGLGDTNYDTEVDDELDSDIDVPVQDTVTESNNVDAIDDLDDIAEFDPSSDFDDLEEAESLDDEFGDGGDFSFDQADELTQELPEDEPLTFDETDPFPGDSMTDDPLSDDPLDLEGELEAEFGDDFSDEFSMGDFGAEFGILEDSSVDEPEPERAATSSSMEEELDEVTTLEQASAFNLTPEEFDRLKETLDGLPLNVRLAVADIISQGTAPFDDLKGLIDSLVGRQPAKKIAALASKITGKKLQIPKGYEKRSGQAFAEHQESFLYQFTHKYWPVIRAAMAITILTSLAAWLSYSYIYQPLYARSLYNQGLEAIAAGQYPRANVLFDRAYGIWPVNDRFLEYARAFAQVRQFTLAQEKYRQLLRIDRNHRQGILEYSHFEAFTMRDYGSGIQILDRILNETTGDYDALLQRADIFMEWARFTQDPTLRTERYDSARSDIVRLTVLHGQTDPLLFRLLLFYVRTGNLARSFRLQQVFEADPKVQIVPEIYAELAGFYLDTWESGQTSPIIRDPNDTRDFVPTGFGPDLLDEAQKLLFTALEANTRHAETHYQLARSFALQDRFDQERRALLSANALFNEISQSRPLTRFEVPQQIDTLIRLGENNMRTGNLLTAEENLRQAISLYRQGLTARLVEPSHSFGRMFAHLGDMYYNQGNDLASALEFYTQALENRFGTGNQPQMANLLRNVHFKMGVIHYSHGSPEGFQQALDHFLLAEGPTPTVNPNLMFSKANTFYQLGNFSAAAAHYQRLITRLVQQRERIATFLITEDSAHRGLIDFKIRAYNNLGATMYQLSRSAGIDRVRRQVEAQFFLSKATELAENVARDIETAVRSDSSNLAFLNLRSILIPGFEGQVLIDPDLPRTLDAQIF
jgi:tetratricopeptide (TPR) repeat protein